jgi:hypothetical protein
MAGDSEVVLRPAGALRNAMVDLRAIHLVRPDGVPLARGSVMVDAALSTEQIAAKLIDDACPTSVKEHLIGASLDQAAQLVTLMTRGLPAKSGNDEVYRRIPWIWRVAIAAGRSRDSAKVRSMLDAALPNETGELTHWQAVVIGGGLINGIALAGGWPSEELQQLVSADPQLKTRWNHALRRSIEMADDQSVPTGTRYDALRMVALLDWKTAEPILHRYLQDGVHEELQMGAVSGLSDVREDLHVVDLYVAVFDQLSPGNQKLAVEALTRTNARTKRLHELATAGKLPDSMLFIKELETKPR